MRPPTFDHVALHPGDVGGGFGEFRLAAPAGVDNIGLRKSDQPYGNPADTVDALDLCDLGFYGKTNHVMFGLALLNFSAPSLTLGVDIPKVGLLAGSGAYSFFAQDFFPAVQLSHPLNGFLSVTYSFFKDAYSGYVGWDNPDFSKSYQPFYFHSVNLYAEFPASATAHYFVSPSVAYENRKRTWRIAVAFGVVGTHVLNDAVTKN